LEKTKNSSNEETSPSLHRRKLDIERRPALVTRSLRYHAIENEEGLSCGSSEIPDIELESTIYEAAVIAIINSIINADRNSLKYLQLPKFDVV